MSRAARRRAEREAAKTGSKVEQKPPQMIQLQNPVTDLFETFIFGNSLKAEDMVEYGEAEGQTIVICGAGPSLADHAHEWCHDGDQLWAANSALTWLLDNNYPVTHAITVDQTPAMVNEWKRAPDVEYLLASTVHPHLTDHLLQKERRLRFFHNFVGIKKPPVEYCECGHDHDSDTEPCSECECEAFSPRMMSYEDWLYISLYPESIRVGSGLNTVNRAVDLAFGMGAAKVVVLGADCALRVNRPLPKGTAIGSEAHKSWLQNDTTMHADGGNALASGATPVTIGGEIDGKWWETKPDMAISAMFFMRLQEAVGDDKLLLVGDTLPNALKGKSEEFLAAMPALLDSHGNPIPIGLTKPIVDPKATQRVS